MTYVAATFVAESNEIPHTPGSAVAMGDVVLLTGGVAGKLVAIAKRPIAASALGSLAVEGVFEADKKSTDATSPGDLLYWDNTNKYFTVTSTSNTKAGVAVNTTISGDLRVRIRLDGVGV